MKKRLRDVTIGDIQKVCASNKDCNHNHKSCPIGLFCNYNLLGSPDEWNIDCTDMVELNIKERTHSNVETG